MKQITQLGRQLAAAWNEFGLNQKISVVTAAVLVLTVLGGLAVWSGRVEFGLLYGGLEGSDASKVVEVLESSKVPYKLGNGGSIYVPRDQVHQIRIQLTSQNIPSGGSVGLEIFEKQSFSISDWGNKVNYQRAMQGELARTIKQMDQIESAEVMIVMPSTRGLLLDDSRPTTASVFVRARGKLPESAVRSIQSLVAHSVSGLEPDEVSVVDNSGNVLSGRKSDSLAGLSSTQLELQREVERYLSDKAEGMLDAVLGPGQAVVRVSAALNFHALSVSEERYDPESQVMRSSTVDDQTVDTKTEDEESSGVAGLIPNATPAAATNGVGGGVNNSSKTLKKLVKNEYALSKVMSNLVVNPGGLERLSAAVFVATRYKGEAPNLTPDPRTPEQLDMLRRSVVSALGIRADSQGAISNNIALEEIEFSATPSRPGLASPGQPSYWLSQLPKLIYPGLAVGMFLVFLRMLKKTPVENIPIGVPLGAAEPMQDTAGNRLAGAGRGNRPPGIVSVDVFNRLVKENPDNMSEAIQNWLGRDESSRN